MGSKAPQPAPPRDPNNRPVAPPPPPPKKHFNWTVPDDARVTKFDTTNVIEKQGS